MNRQISMPEYRLWTDLFDTDDKVGTDVEVVAQKLGREVKIVEEGWKSEINDGAIHPERNWFAWKEYRERLTRSTGGGIICNYYLHIVVNGIETLNWPIKTYNPFFGCVVYYFTWGEDRLLMVYREKHRYYGVSCSVSKVEQLVDLAPHGAEAAVRDNVLYIYDSYGKSSETVSRFVLPDLVELDVMTIVSALDEGVLVVRQ